MLDKENLIILIDNYPFGKGEEFFETEMEYLSKNFDDIYVISSSRETRLTREVPKNVMVFRYPDVTNTLYSKITAVKYFFYKNFIHELFILKKRYKLKITIGRIIEMLQMMLRANQLSEFINQIIVDKKIKGKTYLYSYWMYSGSLAIAEIKIENKDIISFSRSHGYDLYFERNRNNYIPFRSFIVENLDSVFLISENGKCYLKSKLDKKSNFNKLIVSKLGINNMRTKAVPSKDKVLKIVSCSSLSDVKRVNLIVDTLSEITEIDIKWIHIGDGDLREQLLELSKIKLGNKNNITYQFLGHLDNEEIYNYYENQEIDIFINVSKSEGIPVSMMEALSFSIPIIGTNVGGVNEIVNEMNGILLSPNPTIAEVKSAIIRFSQFSDKEISYYRENANYTWGKYYNAEINYNDLIRQVKKLKQN